MNGRAVLVVDDYGPAREVLVTMFEAAGFSVMSAEDGDEALLVAEQRTPDVVVTDLHMPRMNGKELAFRLHRRFGPRAPFVVVTSADRGMVDRLRGDARFFAVLEKPIDVLALIAVVSEAIEAGQDS